jgi:hypothetical protein
MAGDLLAIGPRCGVGEGAGVRIAFLSMHLVKVQGVSLEPGWSPGLEASQCKAELSEGVRESVARSLTNPSTGKVGRPDVNEPLHEGSCGDHNGPGANEGPLLIDKAGDSPIFHNQVLDTTLEEMETSLSLQDLVHGQMVVVFVTHGSCRSDGRALRGIQDPKLHRAPVRHAGHLAPQDINLPDELALAGPTDSGAAGHGSDRIEV